MRINFFRQPDVTLALTTLTSQKRDSDDNVKGNVPLTQQVRLRTNIKVQRTRMENYYIRIYFSH